MSTKDELKMPQLVAAGGILATLIQTSRGNRLERANSGLQAQVSHLMRVLREWQSAHQRMRILVENQNVEIERLRDENARLTAALARAESGVGESKAGRK